MTSPWRTAILLFLVDAAAVVIIRVLIAEIRLEAVGKRVESPIQLGTLGKHWIRGEHPRARWGCGAVKIGRTALVGGQRAIGPREIVIHGSKCGAKLGHLVVVDNLGGINTTFTQARRGTSERLTGPAVTEFAYIRVEMCAIILVTTKTKKATTSRASINVCGLSAMRLTTTDACTPIITYS